MRLPTASLKHDGFNVPCVPSLGAPRRLIYAGLLVEIKPFRPYSDSHIPFHNCVERLTYQSGRRTTCVRTVQKRSQANQNGQMPEPELSAISPFSSRFPSSICRLLLTMSYMHRLHRLPVKYTPGRSPMHPEVALPREPLPTSSVSSIFNL